eukprot:11489435-Heterocapsa_arctica.AAC.1
MGRIGEESPGKTFPYCFPLLLCKPGCTAKQSGSVGPPELLGGRAGESSMPHGAWTFMTKLAQVALGKPMPGLSGLAP